MTARWKSGCVRCQDGIPHEFNHGTCHAYAYHRCRCRICLKGMALHKKKHYDGRPGLASAEYSLWHTKNRHTVNAKKRSNPLRAANHAKWRERLAHIPIERCGLWLPAEDIIAARGDISVLEICYLLHRSYDSVVCRRMRLRKKQSA